MCTIQEAAGHRAVHMGSEVSRLELAFFPRVDCDSNTGSQALCLLPADLYHQLHEATSQTFYCIYYLVVSGGLPACISVCYERAVSSHCSSP